MALVDFTLSNARQFYSSMGNPLGVKGFKSCPLKVTGDYKMSNQEDHFKPNFIEAS